MSNPEQYFHTQFERLRRETLDGQTHYRIWRSLNNAFASNPRLVEISPFFFRMTVEAHMDSVLLSLTKLTDKTRGALSIHDFLRYVEKHSGMFPYASDSEIHESTKRDFRRLDELQIHLERLREHRNNDFIHISKEVLSRPDFDIYSEFPVTYEEIDLLLQTIGKILNRYCQFMTKSIYLMEEWDEKSQMADLFWYLEQAIKTSGK